MRSFGFRRCAIVGGFAFETSRSRCQPAVVPVHRSACPGSDILPQHPQPISSPRAVSCAAERSRKGPPHQVGGPAGRARHHEADRLRRPIGRAAMRRPGDEERGQGKREESRSGHAGPSFACLLPPFGGAGNSARARHRLGTLRQNIRSRACRSAHGAEGPDPRREAARSRSSWKEIRRRPRVWENTGQDAGFLVDWSGLLVESAATR